MNEQNGFLVHHLKAIEDELMEDDHHHQDMQPDDNDVESYIQFLKDPQNRIRWTIEEHRSCLLGLHTHGAGKWKDISKDFVPTKTPIQIGSHAQKYFKGNETPKEKRKRKSIHDTDIVSPNVDQQNSFHTPTPNFAMQHPPQDMLQFNLQSNMGASYSEQKQNWVHAMQAQDTLQFNSTLDFAMQQYGWI